MKCEHENEELLDVVSTTPDQEVVSSVDDDNADTTGIKSEQGNETFDVVPEKIIKDLIDNDILSKVIKENTNETRVHAAEEGHTDLNNSQLQKAVDLNVSSGPLSCDEESENQISFMVEEES